MKKYNDYKKLYRQQLLKVGGAQVIYSGETDNVIRTNINGIFISQQGFNNYKYFDQINRLPFIMII